MPRRKVALRTSATTTALIEDASEPSEAAQSMSTITGPPPTDRRSVSPRFETLATPVPELRGRPKRSASGRKKTSYVEAEEDDEDGQTPSAFADDAFDDETVVAPSPVKHRKASPKKTKKVKKADPEDAEYVAPAEDDLATVADPEASDGAAESDLTPVEDLEGDEKPKKKRKKTASPRKLKEPKPEPIYDIPDVQTLPTTFRGRLGYACLNTVLRNKRPARLAVFCSRTCRLDTIAQKGLDHVKALGLQNSADLAELIQWNEDNGIRFLRVSSEMFPFASHKEHGYDLAFADDALKHAGELANKYGHRLTSHPGQYNCLGSPRKEVVEATFRDLAYHAEMLERLRCGPDGIMIVHGPGGSYGDKPAALARCKENILKLPENVRARLVLENDEMNYSAEDLLPLCEELDVPLVFDYHHDWINPSSIPPAEIIRRTNAIFARRGIRPKQHLSSPRPGAVTVMERRAHSDRCDTLPPDLPDDIDLMIEAKDKEQAVLHLHRIYQLQPVVHASLRPPATEQSLRTKGRKSHKKKKSVVVNEEGEEEEVEVDEGNEDLEDPEEAEKAMLDEQEKVGQVVAEQEAASPVSKKKGGGRKRKSDAIAAGAETVKSEGEGAEETVVASKTKRPRKNKKADPPAEGTDTQGTDDVKPLVAAKAPGNKARGRGKGKKAAVAETTDEPSEALDDAIAEATRKQLAKQAPVAAAA